MNQILENKKAKNLKKNLAILQFFGFCIIIFSIIIYLLLKKYSKTNSRKISEFASKNYSLNRLYYSAPGSTLVKTKQTITSIIGTIEIPKIDISYPILSNCSEELLKISVCKFYGPNLNEVGNLCIAGHNYNNDDFFSNLYLLRINDTVNIYDTSFNKTHYYVYNIYEINPSDMSYLSQNTNRANRNLFTHL